MEVALFEGRTVAVVSSPGLCCLWTKTLPKMKCNVAWEAIGGVECYSCHWLVLEIGSSSPVRPMLEAWLCDVC